MKKSIDEHAERFSEHAADYDENQDSPEYRRAADLVVGHADADPDETVLDLGTGTGAIAFGVAEEAGRVIGRDISEGMLERAREKAADRGVETVEFGEGRFRDPAVPDDADVDIVTSNFAMHHLGDEEKREAISTLAALDPRRIVLGDVMFFAGPDPDEPFYSPEVDDPATVGVLADAFTDEGYALTAVEMVAEQVGVLVADADR
ncbi:methyltransferase domain-containing protein [Halovenus sp. WSH3]|uniref:Methyltransferase domain-containing protein n=1 Tax=Halovenus carboxidivorans TaxID=2692199 RepID=A0A6B0T9M5_9EURY|nr:class I SAM-dependent methyltransferase [Halovenus carboxidivorans]MXR51570.1 methyltransferase domain-containing protein [Halovenus carboxidivorans]